MLRLATSDTIFFRGLGFVMNLIVVEMYTISYV
jgi:hypothetical protein